MGGKPTTAGGGASAGVAEEAREIVRRAAGDVVGKTVAAQVRQAARHLGYGPDDWRVREAWYIRAGSWSAAAVDDLRRRFAAWSEREAPQADLSSLAGRVEALRGTLATLARQVDELVAEIADSDRTGQS